MARFLKQYDPNETYRRIGIEIREQHCPRLLEFMASLTVGVEGPAIRAVFYQWFLAHEQAGSLTEALESVVHGPGGLANSRPLPQKMNMPPVPAPRRVAPLAKSARRSVTNATTASPADIQKEADGSKDNTARSQPLVHVSPTPFPVPAAEPPRTPDLSAAPTPAQSLAPALPEAESAKDDNNPVDLSKLSKIEFDGLMNLETMFNLG